MFKIYKFVPASKLTALLWNGDNITKTEIDKQGITCLY